MLQQRFYYKGFTLRLYLGVYSGQLSSSIYNFVIFKQLESNRSAKLERRLSKKPMLDTIRVGGMEGYCN